MFELTCVLTIFTLFVLGAVKSHFSQSSVRRNGLEIVGIGSVVASMAYGIGALTAYFVGVTPPTI
jgi:VIT1/CCC1 family predicted Fe2+/Mn2+ transporter